MHLNAFPSTALISALSANEAPPPARLYPGTRRLGRDRSAGWSVMASLLALVAGVSKSPSEIRIGAGASSYPASTNFGNWTPS
jgi:hypothetical protein